MKRTYIQPEMTVASVALSTHLMDGSVLKMSQEGGYQEGALAPGRVQPSRTLYL